MRCPKCSFLSLDTSERCSYCGYEFALMSSQDAAASTGRRPRATPLNVPPARRESGPRRTTAEADGGENVLTRPLMRESAPTPLDLPLFDRDFVPGDPVPRPQRPLAVRRAGSVTPRPRGPVDRPVVAPVLPLEPEGQDAQQPYERADASPAAAAGVAATAQTAPDASAEGWRRAAAWAIDAGILALMDAATCYFTLRVAGLEVGDWRVIPVIPFVVFVVLLNLGYTAVMTAILGQTLGKLAMRIIVVADGRPTVGMGRAVARTLLAWMLAAPVLLGPLWTLLSGGVGLHDRLCRTRVVRVALS